MPQAEITLGCKAKDTITGYKGIVIAITSWLNGCTRVTIQSQELKDGHPIDHVTFDIEQIELLEAKKAKAKAKSTGGPHPEPRRGSDPR